MLTNDRLFASRCFWERGARYPGCTTWRWSVVRIPFLFVVVVKKYGKKTTFTLGL